MSLRYLQVLYITQVDHECGIEQQLWYSIPSSTNLEPNIIYITIYVKIVKEQN